MRSKSMQASWAVTIPWWALTVAPVAPLAAGCVEDSETGLGLPPVPPPLGLAVGVVGHLGDADAHAVVRVVGCEFSRSSLERFQSGRCRRVELEARQVAVDVAVMRA